MSSNGFDLDETGEYTSLDLFSNRLICLKEIKGNKTNTTNLTQIFQLKKVHVGEKTNMKHKYKVVIVLLNRYFNNFLIAVLLKI